MDAIEREGAVLGSRAVAVKHVLLGVVGLALAAWLWSDESWAVRGYLFGLDGLFVLLLSVAGLYELAMGILHYQSATRIDEAPTAYSLPTACRRCSRPLVRGSPDCPVCGEPVRPL